MERGWLVELLWRDFSRPGQGPGSAPEPHVRRAKDTGAGSGVRRAARGGGIGQACQESEGGGLDNLVPMLAEAMK